MVIRAVDANAGALRGVSTNRLACLARHWTWADEAMARFERERVESWGGDDDAEANHLFGAYYHWGALLCSVSTALLEQELLSASQLSRLRPDLEACLPVLEACQRMFVVIPPSRENQPRTIDLLREDEMLGRLRRLHRAFGDALREEQEARARDLLDIRAP